MQPRWGHLWRSVEELEGDTQFRESLFREFPEGASVWEDPVSRRRFLQVMGASLALAGLNGCTWFPAQYVVPYVIPPEEIIPGKPLFYATCHVMNGFAKGVLAETHMARPTKMEGNPDHPASLGGTDVYMQASLLDLYDPERGKIPQRRGVDASWDDFYTHLVLEKFPAWEKNRGRGLRILTGAVTSPTLTDLLAEFLKKYPEARWDAYEPISRDNLLKGAKLAFGKPLNPIYHLENAKTIVSIGEDFLGKGPADVRYARAFSDRRRLRKENPAEMNRLYVLESSYSITGASAEHRLSCKPSRIPLLARSLASRLGIQAAGSAEILSLSPSLEETRWLEATAHDLSTQPGQAVILVGEDQPDYLHALGHAMNERIGGLGKTVSLIEPVETSTRGQLESLTLLSDEMKRGEVESLIILGADPIFTAPTDFEFEKLLAKVPSRYCHSVFPTQTSYHCDWYLPQTHPLEEWFDPRAFDGTASFQQPVVSPLYQGKGALEIVAALLGRPGQLASDILKDHWERHWKSYAAKEASFPDFWERVLRDGFIRDSQFPAVKAKVSALEPIDPSPEPQGHGSEEGLEIHFLPDPMIWDGRYASNPWLQEIPKPLTQLTWDNAAMVSFATARKHRLKNEDLVQLELEGRTLEAAVYVLPGQADDTITAHLGYGGKHPASPTQPGEGGGFDFYALRGRQSFWSARNLKLTKTGRIYPLASSQHHQDMAGRDVALMGTLKDYQQNPAEIFNKKMRTLFIEKPLPTLYPDYSYAGEAWAMVIDLTACIGCKVCTLACQAENNIPVVGKTQVRNKREMHWIRVDRYFHGSPEAPGVVFQPVPCMHCEHAPCEYVCPTMATVHDSSGINQMVYNRCIGTRDCSNNCPYKVRRFNFLQYSEMKDPLKKLVYNPDVTVRERGVMEKCTYCIQRISSARINADQENRPIAPGEVVPACAQACPTRAIVFGNKNNPQDEVSRLRMHPLNYGLLEELGTQPRTTYLARIRNLNPGLEPR